MAQITLNSTGVASNGTLALQSNGTTTAVTIDASQNVGIGTASPGSILELNRAGSGAVGPNLYLENSASSATGNASRVSFGIDAGSSAASPTAYIENVKDAAGPGSSYLAFGTFGASLAERMRIDSSGNVGIGTSSPSGASGRIFEVNGGAGQARLVLKNDATGSSSTDGSQIALVGSQLVLQNREASEITFETNGTERARIDSSGNLLVGTTGATFSPRLGVSSGAKDNTTVQFDGNYTAFHVVNSFNTSYSAMKFWNNGVAGTVGTISCTTSATTYATSSDYRLKENVQPMTGALSVVAQLKPCTYTWKTDGVSTQGFIAHELQAVVPECVVGEKDAVDADGKPQYQGVDTSFLVATLTAAIQELKALVDTQASTITQLQADVAALKGTA
jgi:hypothetical protein